MESLPPSDSSPSHSLPPAQVATSLVDWTWAMEQSLQAERPIEALIAAKIVLQRIPLHLASYQRLLRAMWLLKRWDEGEEWGMRLLRADPGNAMAWQMLAMAAEFREDRAQARTIWQRAFESEPYAPEIRVGLNRTSLNEPDALMLNSACLAALYLRGQRWSHAATAYSALVRADKRRIDFQMHWMVALWQLKARQDGYRLARYLIGREQHLLLAWVVMAGLGDDNDKALARSPIQALDPDGDYIRTRLGIDYPQADIEIEVTDEEAEVLEVLKENAEADESS